MCERSMFGHCKAMAAGLNKSAADILMYSETGLPRHLDEPSPRDKQAPSLLHAQRGAM